MRRPVDIYSCKILYQMNYATGAAVIIKFVVIYNTFSTNSWRVLDPTTTKSDTARKWGPNWSNNFDIHTQYEPQHFKMTRK